MADQPKYLYFASDLHLGAPNAQKSAAREKAFISWLDHIKPSAKAIYLLGDVFDFWFEYKTVIPKGFTRLFGKLAELSDAGIEIHFFKGNHDMWVFDYFEKELGLIMHSDAHTAMA
jgi:UDP-2,3-diacylglucosamine hydrolase